MAAERGAAREDGQARQQGSRSRRSAAARRPSVPDSLPLSRRRPLRRRRFSPACACTYPWSCCRSAPFTMACDADAGGGRQRPTTADAAQHGEAAGTAGRPASPRRGRVLCRVKAVLHSARRRPRMEPTSVLAGVAALDHGRAGHAALSVGAVWHGDVPRMPGRRRAPGHGIRAPAKSSSAGCVIGRSSQSAQRECTRSAISARGTRAVESTDRPQAVLRRGGGTARRRT